MSALLKFGFVTVIALVLSIAAAQGQAGAGMASAHPGFTHGAPSQPSFVQRSNFQPSFVQGGSAAPNRAGVRIIGPGFVNGFRRRPLHNSFYYGGWPYWYPYPDYYGSYEPEPVAAEPQAVPTVIQPAKQEPVPDAVLLELQGNQWVKVSNATTVSTSSAGTATPNSEQPGAKELPPAILVYRDGHTEELSSYSIIGTTIYTKADYWASGSWTRKIEIADLDLPATLKQNRERGVPFDLPSGPNEVILRP